MEIKNFLIKIFGIYYQAKLSLSFIMLLLALFFIFLDYIGLIKIN
jgi:hypothetical protein